MVVDSRREMVLPKKPLPKPPAQQRLQASSMTEDTDGIDNGNVHVEKDGGEHEKQLLEQNGAILDRSCNLSDSSASRSLGDESSMNGSQTTGNEETEIVVIQVNNDDSPHVRQLYCQLFCT